MDPKTQHMQQAREMRCPACDTQFVDGLLHDTRAERDALAARVGVLTGLLSEVLDMCTRDDDLPNGLPLRIQSALAEPSAAPVEAASEALAEPVAELRGAEYLADPRTGQAFQASTVATWPAYNRERFTIRLWSAHPIASAIAAARAEGYAAGMDRAAEVCKAIGRIGQEHQYVADKCADAIRAAMPPKP